LIGLDSHGRIEPFQGLALTPSAFFFLYSPRSSFRRRSRNSLDAADPGRILRFLPIRKEMSKKY
jgi:hypothetical protein